MRRSCGPCGMGIDWPGGVKERGSRAACQVQYNVAVQLR